MSASGAARAPVAICLVVCWLAAAPAPAAAVQSFEAGPFLPLAGPRLAGDELVFAQTEPGRGMVVVARPLGGGPARRLHRVRPYVQFQLAASPTQTLVQQRRVPAPSEPLESGPAEVLRVPRSGAQERLPFSCGICNLREVDVSGDVIAYAGPSSDALTIRDFGAPGSPAVVIEPAFGLSPRVAGRYAAWVARRRDRGL